MAFKVYATGDVNCDNCHKINREKVIRIIRSGKRRDDSDHIWVHKSCLLKLIAKAEKKASL